MGKTDAIKCPYCYKSTPLGSMGVYSLSVNLELTNILHRVSLKDIDHGSSPDVDAKCCYCNQHPATVACYSCDPTGCKFCDQCFKLEHERGFAPVRAHKPIPIENIKKIPKNVCIHHPGQPLTHYAVQTGLFACAQCIVTQASGAITYKPLEVAIKDLKERIEPMMTNVEGYLKRLQDSQRKVASIHSQIAVAGVEIAREIQQQFSIFQQFLEERRRLMLNMLDAVVCCICDTCVQYRF